MTRRKRGCFVLLVILAVLVAAAAIAVWLFVPGDLMLGGSASAPAPARTLVPGAAPQPGASGAPGTDMGPGTSAAGGSSNPGQLVSPDGMPGATTPAPTGSALAPAIEDEAKSRPSSWMTYLVPADILQAEVAKAFPIDTNIVDLVRLQLDRPTFLPDTDGNFLRVQLDIRARILEGGQVLPGSAVMRTQLGYDRGGRRVMLRNAQLVELNFSGDAARAASALQPVLAAALAAEMNGYVIYEVPAEGLGWLKAGIGFVRDVYVKDGRVAIGLGL